LKWVSEMLKTKSRKKISLTVRLFLIVVLSIVLSGIAIFITIFLGFNTNFMKIVDNTKTTYEMKIIYEDLFAGQGMNSVYVRSGLGYSLCVFPKSTFDVFYDYTPEELKEIGVFVNDDDEITVYDPFLLVKNTLGLASEPEDIPPYIIRTSFVENTIFFNIHVYQPDLFDKEKVVDAIETEIQNNSFPFPYIFQYPQENDQVVGKIMDYYHYDFLIKNNKKESILQTNIPRVEVDTIKLPYKGLLENVLTKLHTVDDYVQSFFQRKPSFEVIDQTVVGQNFLGYISYGYRGDLFFLYQVALIVGLIVFLLAFFLLNHSIVAYILEIEKGIVYAARGNLSEPIRVKGNNELTSLAYNINQMVHALKVKFEDEKKNIESRANLITNLSHDLLTPISTIMGYITLLQEEKHSSQKEQKEYLHMAYHKAEMLKQMIQNALSYSVLLGENPKANCSSMPWCEMYKAYCEEAKALAKSSGFQIQIHPSSIQSNVLISRIYLDRVIGNIYMNTIKHGVNSHPIVISTEEQEDYIVLCVKNATHCTEDLLKYARSNRLSVFTRDSASGLGLPICHQLMELQHGSCRTKVDLDTNSSSPICYFSAILHIRKANSGK